MESSGTLYVLVIEPNKLLCKALQSICDAKHVATKTAQDVIAGLEQVQQERPSGVILANELDGFSGSSFLGAMQADPVYRDVPIALRTSLETSWFEDAQHKPDHVVRNGPEMEADVGAFLAVLGLLEDEEQIKPANALQGVRMLLAEDSELIQHALGVVLRAAGAQVSIACHGAQALELVEKSSFDLILMDIEMPVLNGIEASCVLRERGYAGAIVALTAHEPAQARATFDMQPFDAVLQKPRRLKDLVADCASFLNTRTGEGKRVA